jgi:hypothetical protein
MVAAWSILALEKLVKNPDAVKWRRWLRNHKPFVSRIASGVSRPISVTFWQK